MRIDGWECRQLLGRRLAVGPNSSEAYFDGLKLVTSRERGSNTCSVPVRVLEWLTERAP